MSVRDIRAESLAEKKRQSEANPCYAEQRSSLKCVEEHSTDSDHCLREFENFKLCKTFWYEIQKFRKANGIEPSLPPIQERQLMRSSYMKTGSLKPIIEDMKRQHNL